MLIDFATCCEVMAIGFPLIVRLIAIGFATCREVMAIGFAARCEEWLRLSVASSLNF
ncbi:MAG TPA: hypothetical protein VI306_03115 [Pyrinomonadaceae bacterium]